MAAFGSGKAVASTGDLPVAEALPKKPEEPDEPAEVAPTDPDPGPTGPEPVSQVKAKAFSLVSYSSEEDSDSDAE